MPLTDWVDVDNAKRLCRHTSGQVILIALGVVAYWVITFYPEAEMRAFMHACDSALIGAELLIAVYKILSDSLKDIGGGRHDAFFA